MLFFRVLPRQTLSSYPRRSSPNPHRLILLRTLCHAQKTQLLCNQANPNSFGETPGVGYPRPFDLARGLGLCNAKAVSASPFRMNTCKTASKQTTLTIFRMNTCGKPGGEGGNSEHDIDPIRFLALGSVQFGCCARRDLSRTIVVSYLSAGENHGHSHFHPHRLSPRMV